MPPGASARPGRSARSARPIRRDCRLRVVDPYPDLAVPLITSCNQPTLRLRNIRRSGWLHPCRRSCRSDADRDDMRGVRRVTDMRDRGPVLGEGMPGHTTGYVEAGRVPGEPRLRRGSGRALSPAWGPAASLLALIGRRSVRCSWPRPDSIRRWTGSPWPGTSACARCAPSAGHGQLFWQRHKRLITAAALTGATVTASGACPRLGREHVRGGRGSATWSAACRGGQAC